MDTSIEKYNENLQKYLDTINYNKYLIEITKCCDYGYLQTFYKDYSLEEVYHNVFLETKYETIQLYLLKNEERFDIPRDANVKLSDFININQSWFTPIYPLPAKVVYRIFLDDGHDHSLCMQK